MVRIIENIFPHLIRHYRVRWQGRVGQITARWKMCIGMRFQWGWVASIGPNVGLTVRYREGWVRKTMGELCVIRWGHGGAERVGYKTRHCEYKKKH